MVSRFLSRLRVPKADINIEVNEGPYKPGDTLNISVTLVPRESFYVREGLI